MPEIQPLTIGQTITPQTTPPSVKLQQQLNQELTGSETKPEEKQSTEVKPDYKDDPRFKSLIRQAQQTLKLKKEIDQEKKVIEEKEHQFRRYREIDELAQGNKLEALKKLGWTLEELNELYLNNGQPTPEMKTAQIVDEKLGAFQKQQQELQQQQQQQQYQAALKQINIDVERMVSQSEDFPIVKTMKAYDTVTNLIEVVFKETGRILSVPEALKETEEYFAESTLEIAKLPKILQKLQSEQQSPIEQSVQKQPKTLTHKTIVAPPASQSETYEQKKQRIIQKYWGGAT